MPAERVPDIARKFVGTTALPGQVDTVSAPAADGSRTVSQVKVNSIPCPAQATQVDPEGEQTRLDVDGEESPAPSAGGQKIAAAAEQVGAC